MCVHVCIHTQRVNSPHTNTPTIQRTFRRRWGGRAGWRSRWTGSGRGTRPAASRARATGPPRTALFVCFLWWVVGKWVWMAWVSIDSSTDGRSPASIFHCIPACATHALYRYTYTSIASVSIHNPPLTVLGPVEDDGKLVAARLVGDVHLEVAHHPIIGGSAGI